VLPALSLIPSYCRRTCAFPSHPGTPLNETKRAKTQPPRGEFHTCVHAGPMFSAPVLLKSGEIVNRDGFAYADFQTGR
jgi:hypothetical protein